MIDKTAILEAAGPEEYAAGEMLCAGESVRRCEGFGSDHYRAQVVDGKLYFVTVWLSGRLLMRRFSCECETYYGGETPCRHVVAAALKIREMQEAEETLHLENSNRFFHLFRLATGVRRHGAETVRLTPAYSVCEVRGETEVHLELSIGMKRQYVLRDIEAFMLAMESGIPVVYGKHFTLRPEECRFDDRSQVLWKLLRELYEDRRSRRGGGLNAPAAKRDLLLPPSILGRFFDAMGDESFVLRFGNAEELTVCILRDRPPIKISLRREYGNARLTLGGDRLRALEPTCRYLLYNDADIYAVDAQFARVIRPLLQSFAENRRAEISIRQGDLEAFFGEIMPELEACLPLKIDEAVMRDFELLPLRCEVYLESERLGLSARVVFRYGEAAFFPASGRASVPENTGKKLVRDVSAERQVLELFEAFQFSSAGDAFIQPDEEKTYDFLLDGAPKLAELAEIYYDDALRAKRPRRVERAAFGVRVGESSMLELFLEHEDLPVGELLDVLRSYRLKKRYHRLKDGAFVPLASRELESAAEFAELLDLKAKPGDRVIKVPLSRAAYLDRLADESTGLSLTRGADFSDLVQAIRTPSETLTAVPESLETVLRGYQKTGFAWLMSLARFGFGGILADDMGLGKTLQVIAFLLATKGAGRPALVVAPTSLVYNWRDECARFAPELAVRVVAGTKEERAQSLADLTGLDAVVATYNTLRQDIELYEQLSFGYCVLDEAQHIKNPNTLGAKAVKRLRAQSFFALTGTPIENTLTELWSIFDVLLPGYLFAHRAFRERIELPIVKKQDDKALRDLRRRIEPFILRRMKRDVLPELPDKIEHTMVCEMNEAQEKVYWGYFAKAQKEFRAELAASGFDQSRFRILALLTRLRQICCHPSLFLEDYAGGSGKLDLLMEIVADAVASGHRLLIFSQFTSMLHMICEKLDAEEFAYFYLDGQTPAAQRLELVNAFNGGERSLFLLSLKAGGTGLNLTGADMVVHFDPWWNPAVEEQAADRAYRIGQNNNVQVLRLVTKDTIEQKIYKLQEKKRALLDHLIQPGETFLTRMSEAELRDIFEVR